MRSRFIVKIKGVGYKILTVGLDSKLPNIYIAFPYTPLAEDEYFAVGSAIIPPHANNINVNITVQDRYKKTPMFSHHLSGQSHIKDPTGRRITDLTHQTNMNLINDKVEHLFTIMVNKPTFFKKYNPNKDKGNKENHNVFIDLNDLEIESFQIVCRRLKESNFIPEKSNIPKIIRPNQAIPTKWGENAENGFGFCFTYRYEEEKTAFIDFKLELTREFTNKDNTAGINLIGGFTPNHKDPSKPFVLLSIHSPSRKNVAN